MPSVVELTTDDAIRKLAAPATIKNGHTIAASGDVAFGVFQADHLEARIAAPHMDTRHATLSVEGNELVWRCTCTRSTRFCKHLVAMALAAQKEGRGDIYKAAGILIHDRKLLHERSVGKPAFIAPGGRIEKGESASQALIRELHEECNISVDESDLVLFGTFSAEAANHPGQQVHMQVFTVKKWGGEISPGAEVEELRWLNSKTAADYNVGSICVHEIIPQLKQANLID